MTRKIFKHIDLILLVLLFLLIPSPSVYITSTNPSDVSNELILKDNDIQKDTFFSLSVVTKRATLFNHIFRYFDSASEMDEITKNTFSELEYKLGNAEYEYSHISSFLNALKYSNMDYEIKKLELLVDYTFEDIKSNLLVGDLITQVDNKKYYKLEDIRESIENGKTFTVIRDEKELEVEIKYLEDNFVGFSFIPIIEYENNTDFEAKFDKSKMGTSAGLINFITFYSEINDIQIDKKIAASGVVNLDGTISPIGGLKQKLDTIDDMDYIILPLENKEDAKDYIKDESKFKYVSNLDEVIEILNKIETGEL